MGKYGLGVNKRTTNLASYGELGRYPLYIDTIISMIKYWVCDKALNKLFAKISNTLFFLQLSFTVKTIALLFIPKNKIKT
jgi:hypothetical protein